MISVIYQLVVPLNKEMLEEWKETQKKKEVAEDCRKVLLTPNTQTFGKDYAMHGAKAPPPMAGEKK